MPWPMAHSTLEAMTSWLFFLLPKSSSVMRDLTIIVPVRHAHTVIVHGQVGRIGVKLPAMCYLEVT